VKLSTRLRKYRVAYSLGIHREQHKSIVTPLNEYPSISTDIGMRQGYFLRLNPFLVTRDLSMYLFVYVMTLTGAQSI